MIRRIERKKAFGMSRGREDRTGILDTNIFVLRRMAHEESLLHVCQAIQKILPCKFVEELLGDGECATRHGDVRRPLLDDVRQVDLEIVGNMSSGGWRANCHHASCVWYV